MFGPPCNTLVCLLHADGLLQVIVEEGSFDVQLVKLHVFCCCHCQQGSVAAVPAIRCKDLLVVNALLFPASYGY